MKDSFLPSFEHAEGSQRTQEGARPQVLPFRRDWHETQMKPHARQGRTRTEMLQMFDLL